MDLAGGFRSEAQSELPRRWTSFACLARAQSSSKRLNSPEGLAALSLRDGVADPTLQVLFDTSVGIRANWIMTADETG